MDWSDCLARQQNCRSATPSNPAPSNARAVCLRPGAHLLDVATGSGALAAAAASRGAQAVGVDLSPRMVELALRLHAGVDFREAEVEHLPFADRSFDAVVCGFGLGHFPRPEAAVAECVYHQAWRTHCSFL